MSAYVVDKAAIDALITVHIALEREADGSHEPPACSEGLARYNKLGAMLWRENVRSVNARYRENKRTPSYRFVAVAIARTLTPKVLSRALGCLHGYEYQACEHDGWETSKAYAWCKALRDRLEVRVPHAPSRYTSPAWQVRPVYEGSAVTDEERDFALLGDSTIDPDAKPSHGPTATSCVCPHGKACVSEREWIHVCNECARQWAREQREEGEWWEAQAS